MYLPVFAKIQSLKLHIDAYYFLTSVSHLNLKHIYLNVNNFKFVTSRTIVNILHFTQSILDAPDI